MRVCLLAGCAGGAAACGGKVGNDRASPDPAVVDVPASGTSQDAAVERGSIETAHCKLAKRTPVRGPHDVIVAAVRAEVGPTRNGITIEDREAADALELAFDEINRFGPGFPAHDRRSGRAAFVLLRCNSVDMEQTLVELAAERRVHAVIGPRRAVASEYEAAVATLRLGDMLLMTTESSSSLTALADDGRIYTTKPSPLASVISAQVLAKTVESEIRSELAMSPSDRVRIAMLEGARADGDEAYGFALRSGFTFNGGASTTASTGDFLYASVKTNGAALGAVTAVLAQKPHLIFLTHVTGEISAAGTMGMIEDAWPADASPPRYIVTSDVASQLGTYLASRPTVAARIVGTDVATPHPEKVVAFVESYQASFQRAPAPEHVYFYDAAYAVAYALVGATDPASGRSIAASLRKLGMKASGLPRVFVGPGATGEDIRSALDRIASGMEIDLEGVSSRLEWDSAGDLGGSSFAHPIFCFGGAPPTLRSSSRVIDLRSRTVGGPPGCNE